jgi:WD40 repeat protein
VSIYADVLVWDMRQPERPLVLSHERDVRGVAWSPDGTRILTWSNDGEVRVWTVDIKRLMARAAGLKVREFTPAERIQFYLP